ncbi:hypothetical protein ES703_81240 [subsurface metagenome]
MYANLFDRIVNYQEGNITKVHIILSRKIVESVPFLSIENPLWFSQTFQHIILAHAKRVVTDSHPGHDCLSLGIPTRIFLCVGSFGHGITAHRQ